MTQQSRIDTLERQLQRALSNVSQAEEKLRAQQETISKLEQEKASLLRAKISSTEDEKKKGKLEERNHLQQKELNALQHQVLQEQKRAQTAEAERDFVRRDANATIQKWKDAEADWTETNSQLTVERDLLQQELSKASAKVQSEQERAHKVQMEVEALNSELLAKTARIQNLFHECAAKDEIIHKLRLADEGQRRLIAQKEEDINDREARGKAMTKTIEELQELIVTLNQRIEGVKSTEADLHHAIDDKSATLLALQQKISFLTDANASLTAESKVMKAAVTRAEEQYSSAREFSESLQSQLSAAQKEAFALRTEMTILRTKSDRTAQAIKSENETISAELQAAREEIVKKRGEIAALEFTLQKSEDDKSALERSLAAAVQATEEAKRETQRLQFLQNQDIADTDERLKKQQRVIDELASELDESSKASAERLNRADTEIQRLKSELASARDAKKSVDHSLSDAISARDLLVAQVGELRAAGQSLETQLSSSNQQLQEAIAQREAVSSQLKASEMNVGIIQQALDERTKEFVAIRESLQQSSIQCEALSSQIKCIEDRAAAAEQGLADRTKELVALEQSLVEKSNQCDRLQSELESKAIELQSHNASLDSRIVTAQAAITHLESELASERSAHASAVSMNADLTGENASLMEKLTSSSAEILQLSQQIVILRSDLEHVHASLSSVTAERNASTTLVHDLEERVHALQSTAAASEELRIVLEKHTKEVNSLKERNASLSSQIAAMETSTRVQDEKYRKLAEQLEVAEGRNESVRANQASLMGQLSLLEKQRLAEAEQAESKIRRLTVEIELHSQKQQKIVEEARESTKRKDEYKEALQLAKEKLIQQKSLRDQETASARQEIDRLSKEVTYWHERAQAAERSQPQKENCQPRDVVERASKKLRTELS